MTMTLVVVDLHEAIVRAGEMHGPEHVALFSELNLRARHVPQPCVLVADPPPRERFNAGEAWRRNGKRKGAKA